jgi:hypothetical protein
MAHAKRSLIADKGAEIEAADQLLRDLSFVVAAGVGVLEAYDAYQRFWDEDGVYVGDSLGGTRRGWKHQQVRWVVLEELRAALAGLQARGAPIDVVPHG